MLLFPFVVYAQTPIDCGQTLAGTISAPTEKDAYTFTASADDGIIIRVRKTSGTLNAYFDLYGPTGGLIQSGNQINRKLTETGTYRIDVRDQTNTATGSYILMWQKMNAPCNAIPVDCGQVGSGSLGTAADPPPWRFHTFSLTSSEAVTIRAYRNGSGYLTAYIELFGPDGLSITTGTTIDRALAAGNYSLLIRDSSYANPGNYTTTWHKINNPCNPVPINCGEIVTGTVSTAGEMKAYTFAGTANDGITVQRRKTSGTLNAYLELYGPSGSRIGSPTVEINTTLPATGTYTVFVYDQNYTNTGDYVLLWQRMNAPCNPIPVDCGQVGTGSIGTVADPPPWRFHTITLTASEAVTIRANKLGSGSFSPYIEFYNPSGIRIVRDIQINMTLAAGTYTAMIRDSSNAYAGNYTLTWNKVNNPCNGAPINCGEVITGAISAAGEMKPYTFTGSANDGITIRTMKVSGTFSPYIELYGPTGSRIGSPTNLINATLPTSGTYTVFLRDQNYTNTGSSLLLWQKMNNPCNATPISCGQVGTGSIGITADPPPWRFHTFTAAAGDAVTIRMANVSGGYFSPYGELYNPSGVRIYQSSSMDLTLASAGTYTLLIRDAGTNTGNYVLTWQKVKDPCNATPINCGEVGSGSITAAGQTLVYTLTGTANDGITIRTRKTSGNLSPYIELYGPTGSRIGSPANLINATLPASGTYTILLRDQFYTGTGDSLITWQRFNNPCAPAINCGQAAAGAIGLTAEAPPWGFYSFTVSANDVITIRAIKTSGTLVPYLELYNSSGGLVTSAAGQINRTMAAGSYILLLRDQSNVNTGNYAVTWQRWNNPCAQAASCSQVMTGSIGITADPPPWRYYSLTASANDSVTVRASKTSGTLTPYLEIYNSSGTQIASGAGQKDMTLTAAGTYTAMVRDQSSINTGD